MPDSITLDSIAESTRRKIAKGCDYAATCQELHGALRMAIALGNKEAEAMIRQLHREAVEAWEAQDEAMPAPAS